MKKEPTTQASPDSNAFAPSSPAAASNNRRLGIVGSIATAAALALSACGQPEEEICTADEGKDFIKSGIVTEEPGAGLHISVKVKGEPECWTGPYYATAQLNVEGEFVLERTDRDFGGDPQSEGFMPNDDAEEIVRGPLTYLSESHALANVPGWNVMFADLEQADDKVLSFVLCLSPYPIDTIEELDKGIEAGDVHCEDTRKGPFGEADDDADDSDEESN